MGSSDNQKSNGISKSGQFLLCTGSAAEEAGSKEKTTDGEEAGKASWRKQPWS